MFQNGCPKFNIYINDLNVDVHYNVNEAREKYLKYAEMIRDQRWIVVHPHDDYIFPTNTCDQGHVASSVSVRDSFSLCFEMF